MSHLTSVEIKERLQNLGLKPPSHVSDADWSEWLMGSEPPTVDSIWVSPIISSRKYEVFDFTSGYDPDRELLSPFGWGRYDEDRVGMYSADFFLSGEAPRTIHMGVDLGAPAGTPVFAPVAARVFGSEDRNRVGDYGATIILQSEVMQSEASSLKDSYYLLFGHLSRASLRLASPGRKVCAGELIGWLGEKHENGGWNPHLHLQMSRLEPLAVDLPGAVSASDRELARRVFPDPSLLLQRALAGWSLASALS